MPTRLRAEPIFDDEELRTLAATVVQLEGRYGYPVDVEWVLPRQRRAGDPVMIVQVRPVTGRAAEAETAMEVGGGGGRWDPTAAFARYLAS
jgi:phosphoenolpyruvate synthase/pyruvate phosphate dikinase